VKTEQEATDKEEKRVENTYYGGYKFEGELARGTIRIADD